LFSYHWDLPTSPLIVINLGGLYFISLIFGSNGGIAWKFFTFKHLAT
jgi:zinc/manganese transport system permease protein